MGPGKMPKKQKEPGSETTMRLFISFALLLLLIAACATHPEQDPANRVVGRISADYNTITRLNCLTRESLTGDTVNYQFHMDIIKYANHSQICYKNPDGEVCYDANAPHTECRYSKPPFTHCSDDRFDGNEIWEIYYSSLGDTLMYGGKVYVAFTGAGCFAIMK